CPQPLVTGHPLNRASWGCTQVKQDSSGLRRGGWERRPSCPARRTGRGSVSTRMRPHQHRGAALLLGPVGAFSRDLTRLKALAGWRTRSASEQLGRAPAPCRQPPAFTVTELPLSTLPFSTEGRRGMRQTTRPEPQDLRADRVIRETTKAVVCGV